MLKKTAENNYMTPNGFDIRKHFEKIGTSVHSIEDIKEAERLGAAYATAGHIYATDCKRGLPPRGLDFLADVCAAATLPVYAIGGIHFDTAQIDEVLARGAAGACIMSEFMNI
jgi:thiamine-phosphate pyrophosphorylase